jgi:hypothetical protein
VSLEGSVPDVSNPRAVINAAVALATEYGLETDSLWTTSMIVHHDQLYRISRDG